MADPIPRLYADCIHRHCRTCHAQPGDYCTNHITRLFRAAPCVTRMADADTQARGDNNP